MNTEKLFENESDWDACNKSFDIETLRGRECYGGLSAGLLGDASFVLVFPPKKQKEDFVIRSWFWRSKFFPANLAENSGLPQESTLEGEFCKPIPIGDLLTIRKKVKKLCKKYRICEIVFDKWETPMVKRVIKNLPVTPIAYSPGVATMSPSVKYFRRLCGIHSLNHLGNPVLSRMAGNLEMTVDFLGNVRLARKKQNCRTDGIAALVMALNRAAIGFV
jgi:phage terminase large subunit-like protein